MSDKLNLSQIQSDTAKYRVQTLISDGIILRADLEKKTWYGGWKPQHNLLVHVEKAATEVEKAEQKVKDAKAKHKQAITDVTLLLKTFDKAGKLYGETNSSSKNDTKKPSVDKALGTVGKDKPKEGEKSSGKVEKFTLAHNINEPRSNQQGNRKGTSGNN